MLNAKTAYEETQIQKLKLLRWSHSCFKNQFFGYFDPKTVLLNKILKTRGNTSLVQT